MGHGAVPGDLLHQLLGAPDENARLAAPVNCSSHASIGCLHERRRSGSAGAAVQANASSAAAADARVAVDNLKALNEQTNIDIAPIKPDIRMPTFTK